MSPRGNRDFLRLWAGETVSVFGSQITLLALPLAAVLTLHAGSFQMGLLSRLLVIPWTVFSPLRSDTTRA